MSGYWAKAWKWLYCGYIKYLVTRKKQRIAIVGAHKMSVYWGKAGKYIY